jgi:hypothetical protein
VVSALTVAVVAQGQTVTVAIPASQRRHAALIYDPSKWTSDGLTRLQDGDPAVTFQACKAGASPYGAAETQFNGGFLVVGPRCVDLAVWVNNASQPQTIRVSFGAGRCG